MANATMAMGKMLKRTTRDERAGLDRSALGSAQSGTEARKKDMVWEMHNVSE